MHAWDGGSRCGGSRCGGSRCGGSRCGGSRCGGSRCGGSRCGFKRPLEVDRVMVEDGVDCELDDLTVTMVLPLMVSNVTTVSVMITTV